MNARIRLALGSLVGAVAIHLVFLACSSGRSGDDASGLDALAASETSTAEAQTPPADAGPTGPMEAPCVANGGQFYAAFNIPGYDPTTTPVRVHTCDYVCSSSGPCATGPDGQPFTCSVTPSVAARPGAIVAACGPATSHASRALLWLR